jgi:hypothetical protein
MNKLFGAMLGGILGVLISFWIHGILYFWISGLLSERSSSFSTEMPAWMFVVIPTGFILGAISGISLSTRYPEDIPAIGKWCIVVAVIFGFLYLSWLRADTMQFGFKPALVETGLSLIWCTVLLVRGIWLIRKGHENQKINQ